MHLAKVIGTIVATQKTSGLTGQRLVLIQPYSTDGRPSGKTLAAVDLASAAPGQMAFYVRGREAAHAMQDAFNPVDAAVLGLVDTVEGGTIGTLDFRFRRDPIAEQAVEGDREVRP
jgi:ethanolamine utilization protein EutN